MARLKKGSAAAKEWGKRMKRLRNQRRKRTIKLIKSKPKRRYKTMARRTKRKASRRSYSILGVNTAKALAAAIYGAMRSKTSNMLMPLTAKIPLGNISDEVGMLAVTTLGKKYLFKRTGILREALTAGQVIELARIGEAVATGSLGINILGMGSSSNNSGYQFA